MTTKIAKDAKLQSVATLAIFRLGVPGSALLCAQHEHWAPNVANIAYLKNVGDVGDLGGVRAVRSETCGGRIRQAHGVPRLMAQTGPEAWAFPPREMRVIICGHVP